MNLEPATRSLWFSQSLGSSILLTLLAVVGILTFYYFWFESTRYAKLGNRIPNCGIKIPLFGNALKVIGKSPAALIPMAIEHHRRLGDVVSIWLGRTLVVAMTDPKDLELILGSTVHLEKSQDYDLFKPWFGDGILISKGEKWSADRKMIAPTFHHSILKTFFPVFNQNARDLVNLLKKKAVGNICDIHDYMSSTTVDVLLETVMGVKTTKKEDSSFKYAKAVMDMCAIIHNRHIHIWLRPDFVFYWTKMFKEQIVNLKIIHSLTDKVVKTKKLDFFQRIQSGVKSLYPSAIKATEEENSNNNSFGPFKDDLDEIDNDVGEKKRSAFLDFMIEASQIKDNILSDQEIRDQVNTIMFEGHDTTAAASSFFICLLGVYQDIQEKVYQEMVDIFQGSDRPVTFADTLEMKYLERVFYETLRMYPPVPLITRVIHEEVKLASGDYILPKETTVGIPIVLIHRNPKYFPNPDKFDPDNFLPERCQERPYYSFIPFSAGPRSCVGRKYAILKLKVLLSTIVRNFKIKSVVSEEEFQLQPDIILKRFDGFRVILESR